VEAGVPEGPKAGVGKDASAGMDFTSISGDASTGAALLLIVLSHVYSASIHRISVEDMGVTSLSLFSSRETPTCRHSSVISTGKGKDIWRCLALMAISYSMISPKLNLFLAMMDPR